jgi:hypothetical protein
MHIVMMFAFVGILAVHLAGTYLIWRKSDGYAPLKDSVKLSLFTSALWLAVAFIALPLVYSFAVGPLWLFGNILSDSSMETFESRVFDLTFGLPTILSRDNSILSILLLPPILIGLSLLPLLAKRGFGSFSFWVTTLVVGYFAFFFGAANVVDMAGQGVTWIAIWAVVGAVVGFSVKLAQSFMIRGQATQSELPTLTSALRWTIVEAVTAVLGLLLGTIKAGTDQTEKFGPAFAGDLSQMVQVLLAGSSLAAIIGVIAAITLTRPLVSLSDQPEHQSPN